MEYTYFHSNVKYKVKPLSNLRSLIVPLLAEFPLKVSPTLTMKAVMEERARKFLIMSRCCSIMYTVSSKKP